MEQGPGPFQKQCFGRNRIQGDGDHLLRNSLVDPSVTFGQIRKSARNPGQRGRPFFFFFFCCSRGHREGPRLGMAPCTLQCNTVKNFLTVLPVAQ